MRLIFLTNILINICLSTFAQKPPLSIDSYKSWPSVGRPGISNDGNYAFYRIDNYPVGGITNVICATRDQWKMEFGRLDNLLFSNNSKEFLAMLPNDTLLRVNLTNHTNQKTSNISSYKLFMAGSLEWLATTTKINRQLSINPLNDSASFHFLDVINYVISPDGNFVIVQQSNALQLVNLKTKQAKEIFNGEGVSNVIFDHTGQQIVFILQQNGENSIWLYKGNTEKAIPLKFELRNGILDSLQIQAGGSWKFSPNDKSLYFSLKEKAANKTFSNLNLIVWNYQDAYLQTDELQMRGHPIIHNEYMASVNLVSRLASIVTFEYEEVLIQSPDYLVIQTVSPAERKAVFDNYSRKKTYILYSLKTNERILLKEDSKEELKHFNISPSENFIVYFDPELNSYISYSIKSKIKVPIFGKDQESLISIGKLDYPKTDIYLVGICGWSADDKSIFINGTYNIWAVDPTGKKMAKNLTNVSGNKEKIIYSLPSDHQVIPDGDGNVLLSAFNFDNKDLALGKMKVNEGIKSSSFNFSPKYTGDLRYGYPHFTDYDYVKAKNSEAYVIRLETVSQAPNYFFTTDFKNYVSLSNLKPQEQFNWMTSELHKYEDSTGRWHEGVLYKPEDFDVQKTYPIIFNYYEKMSNELNKYESPENVIGDIHVAWLVSNGYLVFKTNIISDPGKPGEGALNSVNAAADYFSKFKWINHTKMGISGNSFGGFETNYIVTHSHRFAAAVAAGGVSNVINLYNEFGGDAGHNFVQYDQIKLVKSLSDDPDLYMRNSPIFFADNLTTPLLLMNNLLDHNVEFVQGLFFFKQLRSLKKPVWMISYKNNAHGIGETNAIDYYTRLSEFFDYTLKDKAIPLWMESPVGQ
jgi:dipeptidyl aminopeptidase/acylaminoacyl peptidase